MHREAKSLYADTRIAHASVFNRLLRLQAVVAGESAEELVDVIYALREAAELLDDARKECNRLSEVAQRLACVAWMQTDGSPVRTDYCIGSPDVKQTASTPRPGSPEYDQLIEFFGVPASSPFRPHWPSMVDAISELGKQGKPLPPGIDPTKMMTVFKVTVRKKKPVLDEDIALPPQTPDMLRAQAEIALALRDLSATAQLALRLTELSAKYAEFALAPNLDEEEEATDSTAA